MIYPFTFDIHGSTPSRVTIHQDENEYFFATLETHIGKAFHSFTAQLPSDTNNGNVVQKALTTLKTVAKHHSDSWREIENALEYTRKTEQASSLQNLNQSDENKMQELLELLHELVMDSQTDGNPRSAAIWMSDRLPFLRDDLNKQFQSVMSKYETEAI